MEYELYNTELYHHGTKGMKWGIRRYQNKDGSLTALGKKRRASEEDQLKEREKKIKSLEKAKASRDKLDTKRAELDAREKALKNPTKPEDKAKLLPQKPKSVKDMSDDEVRNHINRMMLEKQYYDTRKSLAASNPPQVSKGKKFVNSLLNDVIAPAAKEAGRKWATNFLEEKLGLNKKTELQRLEDTWKKLDYKKKISDLQKGIDDNKDPYGLKDIEALAKRAKADYEIADYKNKAANIGKDDDPYGLKDLENRWKKSDYEKKIRDNESPSKPEKIDWDAKTKEQTYIKNLKETAQKQKEYEEWLEEERKKREQGGK